MDGPLTVLTYAYAAARITARVTGREEFESIAEGIQGHGMRIGHFRTLAELMDHFPSEPEERLDSELRLCVATVVEDVYRDFHEVRLLSTTSEEKHEKVAEANRYILGFTAVCFEMTEPKMRGTNLVNIYNSLYKVLRLREEKR